MKLEITINDYQIIRQGLFELPVKISLALIQNLDEQIKRQVESPSKTAEVKEEK